MRNIYIDTENVIGGNIDNDLVKRSARSAPRAEMYIIANPKRFEKGAEVEVDAGKANIMVVPGAESTTASDKISESNLRNLIKQIIKDKK